MENVTQNVSQENNNKGLDKMEKMSKAEKMSLAINEFILSNDFLTRYISDGVKEKIYDEKMYHDGMIEEVIENDLQSGYNGGYISDMILDEIEIYSLIDKIHESYKDEFIEIAQECNKRN